VYQQQQRLQEAGQMYVQALRILALYYADSLAYVSCLTSLGMLAFAQHTPDQAEDLLQRAIKLCSSFFPNSLAYAHCSAGLATLYRSQSRTDQAIEHYLKACQLYMVHSPDSNKHAECLVELGDAYKSVRKWKEARDKHEKAAQIFSTLCPGSDSHITTVCKLADTLLALQQWTLAEEQYLTAIDLCGQSSLEQAKCRELLSSCYLKSQRMLKAEEQMVKASEIHLSHPTVLESCDFFAKLGVFYKQLQRPKDAEQWFAKACDLYRSRHPSSDNYAVCLANFALLYRQMHSISDADRLVQLAQDIGTSNAESIATCLMWLGALCSQRNQLQSAEELWVWACDRLEGATSLPRARCLHSLGDLCLASERCTEAEAWYLQALTVYGSLPLNADYPRCFVSLAKLYERKTLKEAAAVQVQNAKMQFGALNLHMAVSECDATLRRLRGT
jgi:tetratricopeptide (TPR) repeat protein